MCSIGFMESGIDMNDPVIIDAKQEMLQLGTVTTSTFMALTALGLDAEDFVNKLETDNHG